MKIEMEVWSNESKNRIYITRSDMLIFRFYFTELPAEIRINVKRNRIFHSTVYNFVGRQTWIASRSLHIWTFLTDYEQIARRLEATGYIVMYLLVILILATA